MPTLASLNTCTGCLACIDTCNQKALSVKYNSEGHLTYAVDQEKCVECGLCMKTCPVVSDYKYGSNNIKNSIPYAAWGLDWALRKNSTSGGVFGVLAYNVISNGGVVIGVSLDNNIAKHIIIENVRDIWKLQGSKYTQSDASNSYRTTQKYLKEGRTILYSGTGCQVAGLLSFLGQRKYAGFLITVDIICGGVPSRFIIDRYLQQYPNVREIVGFRNKSDYELSVIDINGEKKVVPINERPFPLCGFYTELTNRYACYDCKFNGTHRKSDITIGDYWGDTEYPEQHKAGLSIAVAHSEIGKEILKNANLEIHEIGWDNFLLHNPRMIDGYKKTSQSKERHNLAKAFKEYSYEKLLQVYANKATWREPILFTKKIIKYMVGRLESIQYRRRLKNIIKRLHEQ